MCIESYFVLGVVSVKRSGLKVNGYVGRSCEVFLQSGECVDCSVIAHAAYPPVDGFVLYIWICSAELYNKLNSKKF